MRIAYIIILLIITIYIMIEFCIQMRKYYATQEQNNRIEIPSKLRRKLLIELYNFAIDCAEKAKVNLFLTYGTLLGQVRNNDLICWDYDLDFGILNTQYNSLKEVILTNASKQNYKVDTFPFLELFGYRFLQVWHPSGINFDISDYKIKNNKIGRTYPDWFIKISSHESTTIFNIDDVYPLHMVSFLGRQVFIFSNTDVFLKSWYGDNYIIPDKKCNCERCIKLNNV